MSMVTKIIKRACKNLDIKYTEVAASGVFGSIKINDEDHLVISANLGLNNEVIAEACKDKSYTSEILKDKINIPKTSTYVDSHPPELYESYSSFKSNDQVVNSIIATHSYPVVLKPNSKSMGINVFKCENEEEVKNAVNVIFNKDSYKYDHVLLAQDFVDIELEYRVLVYKRQIQFFYKKDNDGTEFIGNLSPLHFKNAKAVLINDIDLQDELQTFINPVFEKLDVVYAGFDIAKDSNGKLWLFEINSKPGFNYFVKDNSDEVVVKMFENILTEIKQ